MNRDEDRRRQIARAVLVAPLDVPSAKWSSRSIAATLGVTQARVARVWRPMSSPSRLTGHLEGEIGSRPMGLVGMIVRPEYAMIVLETPVDQPAEHTGTFASVAAQRSLRTILAAEFARDRIAPSASSSQAEFWESVSRQRRRGYRYLAIGSAPAPTPEWVDRDLQCQSAQEWLSLFGFFAGAHRHLDAHVIHAVEDALRQWYSGAEGDFAWVNDRTTTHPHDRSQRSPVRSFGPERALADEIIELIRDSVAGGRLAGGDRVSDRFLSTHLHTSRAQARAAMRLLERDGLFTVTTGRTVVIPIPTTADVLETYAARTALGSMVIRAATQWTPDGRSGVLDALGLVHRCAAAGDLVGCARADMLFQDAIADASGLLRIAPMMHVLADHIRVFTAVMGLDYRYPTDAIVRDDEALLAAISAGDAERAVRLWRAKMDDARTYMIERLPASRRR